MNPATAASAQSAPRAGSTRIIIACSLGNALELFDFVAYAMFAPAIARNFFPTDNELTSLLATFAAFAVGFVMRPAGAALLGAYADRAGRKAALSLTILLMALGTAIIAVTPGYHTLGLAAPVLVVTARLIQGLSAGGEVGGAISFLAEHAPAHRRGYFTAWQQMSVGAFYLFAGGLGFLITTNLTPEQVDSWGWRIPFFCGLAIAPVGLYIRSALAETPLFEQQRRARAVRAPLWQLVRRDLPALLLGTGVVVAWTVVSQLINYMPTYTQQQLGMRNSAAFIGFLAVGLVSMLSPAIGAWCDRIGRRPPMMTAALGLTLLGYPLFAWLAAHPHTGNLIAIEFALAILLTLYSAPAAAFLAEMFPTSFRSTGISLAYSASVTVFGGMTPMISLLLIQLTGNRAAPGAWLSAAGLLSLICLARLEDRTRNDLH